VEVVESLAAAVQRVARGRYLPREEEEEERRRKRVLVRERAHLCRGGGTDSL
jgi:hypothetical protein